MINISGLKEYIYTLSLGEDDRMKNILQIRDNMERKYKRIYDNTNDINNNRQTAPAPKIISFLSESFCK